MAGFNNMANILGGNVMVIFSKRLKYLIEKTGTFVKIRRFYYISPLYISLQK